MRSTCIVLLSVRVETTWGTCISLSFFLTPQQPFYKAQSFIWFVLLKHETGSWFRPAIHPLCPSQGPRMELLARPGPAGHWSQKASDWMKNIFVCLFSSILLGNYQEQGIVMHCASTQYMRHNHCLKNLLGKIKCAYIDVNRRVSIIATREGKMGAGFQVPKILNMRPYIMNPLYMNPSWTF